ncbi:MAG: putative DNA binding domain-containing protein [Chloroflexi bacterium]|nr:putative DNA binding domain-containing protein [Chloroflexota bacterium]
MEEILKRCDVCPTFQFQYATCLLSMDRIDEAQARLERLSALKPDDPDIVYLRAEIVKQRNGIGEALPLFKEYARLDPSSSSLAMYIQAANDAGQTEEAARLALELLDRCPYDPTAVRIGLSVLDQMGNPEAVVKASKKLLRAEHDMPEYFIILGVGLEAAARTDLALRAFNKALKLEPDNIDALCSKSSIQYDRGHYGQAKKTLHALLKIDPVGHGKYCLLNLSRIAGEHEGDWTEALLRAVQAAKRYPEDSDVDGVISRTIERLTHQMEKNEQLVSSYRKQFDAVRREHEVIREALSGLRADEGGVPLELALAEQEAEHVEFIVKFPDQARELAKEIAAFGSQHGGGSIFLGVSNSGEVVGLEGLHPYEERDKLRNRISQLASKSVKPGIDVTVYFIPHGETHVAKIWVARGPEPIYYIDGTPYIRDKDSSRPATPEEVKQRVAEHAARMASKGRGNGH